MGNNKGMSFVMIKKINIREEQFNRMHGALERMRNNQCELRIAKLKQLARSSIDKAFALGKDYEIDEPLKMEKLKKILKELESMSEEINYMP